MEQQNKISTNNLGELGWIGAAIGAALSIVSLLINKYGGSKDKDPWNSWDAAGRREYVRQGLIVATELYLKGEAPSIDEAMAVIIGQVETDVTYEYWKNHANNTEWKAMVNQAQIDADKKKNNILATLFNPNILLWALGFSVIGFGFYWFRFRDKPQNQLIANIKNKTLT